MSNQSPNPSHSRTRWITTTMRWLHVYVSMAGFLAMVLFAATGLILNHPEWFGQGQDNLRQLKGTLDRNLLLRLAMVDGPEAIDRQQPREPVLAAEDSTNDTPLAEPAMAATLEDVPLEAAPLEAVPVEETLDWEPTAVVGDLDGQLSQQRTDSESLGALIEVLGDRHSLHGQVVELSDDPEQLCLLLKGPGYSADLTLERATGGYLINEYRGGWLDVLSDLHQGHHTGPIWQVVIDLAAIVLLVAAVTGLVLLLRDRRRRVPGLIAVASGCCAFVVIYIFFVP